MHGQQQNSEDPPIHGPLWPGHRTFLSIYSEQQQKKQQQRHGQFTFEESPSSAPSDPCWLLVIAWCNVFLAMCASLQGPFFTPVQTQRRLSSFQTAVVFVCFKAAVALGACLSRVIMSSFYPSSLLICGIFLHGVASAAFGALYWMPGDEDIFWGTSAGVQAVTGLGYAFYMSATLSVLLNRYQSSITAVIIFTEITCGLGGVIGPIAGFHLIEVWQYPLPYFVMGGCVLFGIIASFAVPIDPGIKLKTDRLSCSEALEFLGNVPLWFDLLTACLSTATMAYFELVLVPHFTSFHFTIFQTSYSFPVLYGGYALGAISFGIVASVLGLESLLAVIAQLASVVSFLLVGQQRFFNIPAQLWMVRLGLGLAGFAAAGQFVPAFSHAVKSGVWRGYPCNLWATSTIVSAMLSITYACGSFTSLFSGVVVDTLGTAAATTIMLVAQGVWTIVRVVYWLVECIHDRRRSSTAVLSG